MEKKVIRNDYHRLIVNLHYTHNYLSEEVQKKLNLYDLSIQQYRILRILNENGPEPLTMTEVKNKLLDKNADVTRLVDRLEKKNWVVREIDPQNRRRMNLFLTEQSRTLMEKVAKEFEDFELLVNHLQPTEVKTLNELLEKIRNRKAN